MNHKFISLIIFPINKNEIKLGLGNISQQVKAFSVQA